MGMRGLLTEDKYHFKKWWVHLWDLPVKDKKLWLGEVEVARKCGKWSRDRETSGLQLSRKQQRVHGSPRKEVYQAMRFRTPYSSLVERHKPRLMYYMQINGSGTNFLINNHYTLGVKWFSTCNAYLYEEERTFKHKVLSYNHFVAVFIHDGNVRDAGEHV